MRRLASLLAIALLTGGIASSHGQDKSPPAKGLPDGVYAVLRESLKEKEVRPLKDKEALAVYNHKYLKKEDKEPPQFLVVRTTPDVVLDLAAAPKAEKKGDNVLRIGLKLKPKAAEALERLTANNLDKHVAVIIGGEVVTMHKIRAVIKGGNVEITSCAPGAANYLLEQLQRHYKSK